MRGRPVRSGAGPRGKDTTMRRLLVATAVAGMALAVLAAPAAATPDRAAPAAVTPSFAGVVVTGITLGTGNTDTAFAAPGSTVAVHVSYRIQDTACVGCIDQIEIGWAHAQPAGCAYSGIPGAVGVSGSGTVNLTV